MSGGPPPAACYASVFSHLFPSTFEPGTDPNIVACYQLGRQDENGFIDDKELQRALSSYNQTFSLRTVQLLIYFFTNSDTRKIGPMEFTSLFYSLQSYRAIFEKFNSDRTGKIGANELSDALMSLGIAVSPTLLELLVTKFDKIRGDIRTVEYENFVVCCLIVNGLTEKFKKYDSMETGKATFTYEEFMLAVLPYLIE